jgi:hypothetical protein
MQTYKITATYTYTGTIEAPTAEIAETLFLANLNDHYESTDEFAITPVEHGDE